MKIALVTYEYPPDTAYGGIATYARQAAVLLKGRGHQVEVFSASPTRTGHCEESGIAVNLVNEMERRRFAAAIEPVFAARHAQVGFDVVESPEYFAEGSAILASHPEVPHVVKLHTPTELVNRISVTPRHFSGWLRHQWSEFRMCVGALRKLRRRPYRSFQPHLPRVTDLEQMEREYVERCDFVVSPSASLRDWVVREWSIPQAKTMVVSNPYIPNDRLLRIPAESPGKTVSYFGRLEHRKGVTDLLDAIPLILAEEPEARFRLVGASVEHAGLLRPYTDYLWQRLKPYRHAIDAVGPQPLDEMPDQYASVDVCVYPSIWENFPNVCLEAMSAARAIVASQAGGMAEMLDGGTCGLLVPPRDPPAIASAVVRLLRDRSLRENLGRQARERLLRVYGTDTVGPLLEQSYESAIRLNNANRQNVRLSVGMEKP